MNPADLAFYGSVLGSPALCLVAGLVLLRAVRSGRLARWKAVVGLLLTALLCPAGSLLLMLATSSYLHGDGALAIIAAPVTSAITLGPVLLFFLVAVLFGPPRR